MMAAGEQGEAYCWERSQAWMPTEQGVHNGERQGGTNRGSYDRASTVSPTLCKLLRRLAGISSHSLHCMGHQGQAMFINVSQRPARQVSQRLRQTGGESRKRAGGEAGRHLSPA